MFKFKGLTSFKLLHKNTKHYSYEPLKPILREKCELSSDLAEAQQRLSRDSAETQLKLRRDLADTKQRFRRDSAKIQQRLSKDLAKTQKCAHH